MDTSRVGRTIFICKKLRSSCLSLAGPRYKIRAVNNYIARLANRFRQIRLHTMTVCKCSLWPCIHAPFLRPTSFLDVRPYGQADLARADSYFQLLKRIFISKRVTSLFTFLFSFCAKWKCHKREIELRQKIKYCCQWAVLGLRLVKVRTQ